MLSALMLMCAGAVLPTNAFYEPVDNARARPFYKSPPPPVTDQPHPLYTIENLYEPRKPTFKPVDRVSVPVYEPLEDVPSAPVYTPIPVYKPVEHVPEPEYTVSAYVPPNPVPPSQPGYQQLSNHKHASSFQNVAYKVTQQAYREAVFKPHDSAHYR